MTKTLVLFGSTGPVGRSLKKRLLLEFPGVNIIDVSRTQGHLKIDDPPDKMARFIKPNASTAVFYCTGPTDPYVSLEIHQKIHIDLCQIWLQWFLKNSKLENFFTFGSIHENLPNLCRNNSYLSTKLAWFESLEKRPKPLTHLQLHSIYGHPVRPNSFPGQMLKALRDKVEFKMSKGTQLREYHHSDDIADVVLRLMHAKDKPTVAHISHGRPIALKDLASGVFRHFRMLDNLSIGVLASRAEEPKELSWGPAPQLYRPSYRDPVKGLTELFEVDLKNLRVD